MAGSTNPARADHFTRAQIILHWTIAALALVQLLSHEAMEDAFEVPSEAAMKIGESGLAMTHAISGNAIFLLMLVRIALRVRFGAPPLPADMPQWQTIAAKVTHYAFYALLIVIPLAGFSAVALGSEDLGGLHGTLVALLWVVLILHVAGALQHAFIRRDGVFQRMLTPR
jgi:cytochrome b561